MKVRHKREASILVIWSVLGLMLTGMGTLVAELWQLQVQNQSGFDEAFRNQSVRRVRLPAVRGRIYDTHEECLADSVPNYCIAIYTAELRSPRSGVANTLELVHEIRQRIGREADVSFEDIKRHMALSPHQRLEAWKNLTPAEISKWRAAFEVWTAPQEGSFRRTRVPGLDLGRPIEGSSIMIDTAELDQRPTRTRANTLELVYTIAERIGKPVEIDLQDIKNHIYARRPLPLLAWENIDAATMAKWADTCSNLTGTDIYYKPDRTYPEGENLSHLIGFTREADEIQEEQGEHIDFDMRGLEGIKGLESTYNDLLGGEPGYKLVQIDVSGFHHRDLQEKAPRPGGDLMLTIDRNIQRFATEALAMRQDGEVPDQPVRGAVVVLDPNNGDVLALASSPSFDPNKYMTSAPYRIALNNDPSGRANNRAVYGQYPPGSTFKPIAALGVLREYPEYAEVTHVCEYPWYVDKERHRYKKRCWVHPSEHGEITLRQALMFSCNCYMYEMALEVGFEPIHSMAEEMGIGQYAGLFPDLEEPPAQKNSSYGNLPDKANNKIDLCNMAIGQGAITASPLQMAMVAATIANGGTLYRPRLVRKWRTGPMEEYNYNPTWAIRRIDIPMEALELVRGGMFDVVNDPYDGTAKKAQVPGVTIAGKTGSAQYRKVVNGETVGSVHAWMISFAPYDFPRYAVAMMVEDGVSGGRTIGPRLSYLYSRIFEYDGTLKKEVM
ncbi:MAG: hypothetical protein JXR25_12570 [Pontiellaceae bacterium]|nr:hypothetical protein [Pontiellaceae bacterium]MBN2785650.1 hypothetical protein [Pontiellaceae bacterium]